jgi:nicotinamide-nucleotide amidase
VGALNNEIIPMNIKFGQGGHKGRPYCSLICVGSELLRGKINTHASTIARRLASIGLELSAEHTLGDDEAALARLIRRALQESRGPACRAPTVVIVTGGLGPTFDDVTREAAASACGRPLELSKKLLNGIQTKFKRARLRRMPPANARQAYLIEGAEAIPNTVGTAPGQWIELVRKGAQLCAPTRLLILLPGPPSELTPMLDAVVLPRLRKAFPAPPMAEAHLHFVGVPESIVDHKIRPIIAREKDVRFTILAHLGLVDFDIFVADSSQTRARKRLVGIVRRVRRAMGRAFYGMDLDYPLEKVVLDSLKRHKDTLAVAESCTGGMLAKQLTDIPGSSACFVGGVVSYSNDVKRSFLGVSEALIKKHGAVSGPVAAAMASGVRARMGSAWGVGITGIAGPAGGTRAKPVGLVYLGLAGPGVRKTLDLHLRGSRDAIRQRTVLAALDMLRRIYL